jgi:hypothetical protein
MSKRLKEIIYPAHTPEGKKRITEVEIVIDKILFHLTDGGIEEIPCHSAYNHSPTIKFEQERWEEVLAFLDRIPEQPIVLEWDVNNNGITLSDVTILF